MRRSPVVLAALVLAGSLLLRPAVAPGQGATTGSIRGQVVSSEGAAVPNAQVVVRNTETGLSRGVLTDASGRYAVLLLPSGTYTVQVQSLGFAPATVQEVRVSIGVATPLEVRVSPQAVAIEGVTVTGARARIDPTQGGVVQTITPEQVENLPVAGRDFTDFLNLSPLVSPQPGTGTGGQFSIGGARTSGTNVQIDGADANNQFFGENRGSSRTPFAFSLESIKEFQLITNGFDVEYGNYQGGVVNAVTKGGTNEFRGSAFAFFRDEALTGDDFEGNAPTAFQVQQFGFSASGPIVRDRLHFFASLDGQNKDQPIEVGTAEETKIDPADVQSFRSILQSRYGVQDPELFYGNFQQAEDNLVLFGRVDWSINDRHRLTVRQNYSDFEQTNDRVRTNEALTHGGPFRNESYSTVAELNSVLGRNAFNTFRFQWSDEDRPRPSNEPGGYLPEFRVDIGTRDLRFGGDGIIFRNRLEEAKLQLVNNFTYRAGSHTLKLGTNNIRSTTTNTFWLLGNGSFRYRSLQDFADNRPDSYFRLLRACPVALQANAAGELVVCPEYDVPFAEFTAWEWSLYAQDDWQASDRLLLTAGLRYGGTTFDDQPGRLAAVETAFGIPTGVVPDFTGLSPRLAFTYDLGGEEQQLIRGGVGLLIGRAPTVLAGNVFQTEKPLLSIFCSRRDGNVPTVNMQELLNAERGQANPAACVGGDAPTGRPEHTVFSPDFSLPKTLKANLGFERLLGSDTKVGVDFVFSESWESFNVRDLNLGPERFTLATEGGRPVFVPQVRFNPTRSASTDRLRDRGFDRIYYNVSEGEARAYNLTLELDQRLSEVLQLGARYAYSRAFDNSSFSCCTSGEGFGGEPTAGDPNFIGDPGDEERGTWAPSRFERRHTFVTNFLYRAPWGIRINGIWRSQSGTPWTPLVDGDVNGDGLSGNDRAFVGTELSFTDPAERAQLQALIDANECLGDQVGRIVRRNSCRNPWWHSVDLRLSREVRTVGNQRAEIVVDAFNVLNGLNSDWGRFMGVFGPDLNLLRAERFDATSGQVVYSVNENFGDTEPVGFDPFQFQLQLGVRYRF